MTWTKPLLVATCLFSGLSVWACGDDAAPSKCGKDDPNTDTDESECKALANVKDGATALQQRNCFRCHGQDMAGQSDPLTGDPSYAKNIQGLDVKLYPPNLTNDQETGIGKWTDDQLALAVRNGIDKDGQALCPQMNHYADMSDYEVYSIVMQLRALPPVSKKVPRSVCPPEKE
jgi:hypothetical protein